MTSAWPPRCSRVLPIAARTTTSRRGDDKAWLGASRLSIIDLEGGRQPLTDESGLILASQNGEIYNYVELRADLERRGHTLPTAGDTETIVHLYEEYGTRFVEHLRGMFAIAIWDGRDGPARPGPRPARQEAAVLAAARRAPDLRLGAEGDHGGSRRSSGSSTARPSTCTSSTSTSRRRWTILEGVNKLPPASVLIWDGGEPHIERYWSPSYEPKAHASARGASTKGCRLLREAVRLRLRSDVPVGVFLSGGMDSSVVTALMAEQSAEPVRTFSIGFEDAVLRRARLCARRRRALRDRPHRRGRQPRRDRAAARPRGALRRAVRRFVGGPDLPRRRSWPPRQLKVVLTGDGGDETFGGYSRYRVNGIFGTLDLRPDALAHRRGPSRPGRTRPLGSQSRTQRRLRIAEGAVRAYARTSVTSPR